MDGHGDQCLHDGKDYNCSIQRLTNLKENDVCAALCSELGQEPRHVQQCVDVTMTMWLCLQTEWVADVLRETTSVVA